MKGVGFFEFFVIIMGRFVSSFGQNDNLIWAE